MQWKARKWFRIGTKSRIDHSGTCVFFKLGVKLRPIKTTLLSKKPSSGGSLFCHWRYIITLIVFGVRHSVCKWQSNTWIPDYIHYSRAMIQTLCSKRKRHLLVTIGPSRTIPRLVLHCLIGSMLSLPWYILAGANKGSLRVKRFWYYRQVGKWWRHNTADRRADENYSNFKSV